ncbi:MAG TPA: DEAD/DEAH box helicase [Bacteroidia bacterium]|jgi:ATP-dependent RNA helicase RhlE|nr:DEAD/DEAH box helicase [Bacteroidia bacterium]
MSFSPLGLSAPLLQIVSDLRYPEAYPVQQAAIPAILKGRDVLCIAPTGSGKTASFALPMLELLQGKEAPKNRHIRALVLVPTRELAQQTEDVFLAFSLRLPERIKVIAVHGGVSINTQMLALQGTVILIATPGRLLELIDSNAVHLSETEILVLDEADKMLNQEFKKEMNRLFAQMPAKRQNLLFSATLGKDIHSLTDMILRDPLKIEISVPEQNPDLIRQSAYRVTEERKGPLLRYLIREHQMEQVLVFASSVHRVDAVVSKLKANGIAAKALHSKKSQGARTETMKEFKSGKLKVLVATDLASRGIDIQFLPFVINYELPRSPKDYIHRIGRTGRAESPGQAISFVSGEEEHHFGVIQKKMGKKVELIDSEGLKLI